MPLKIFKILNYYEPFTLRGALALSFSLIALFIYAVGENDLIAYMLGGIILGLVVFVILTLVFIRLFFLKSLSIKIEFNNEKKKRAKENNKIIILITNLKLLPFFYITITPVFKENGVKASSHRLTQHTKDFEVKRVLGSFIFPHRGIWNLTHIKCELNDSLNFSKLTWNLPIQNSIEVYPPLKTIYPPNTLYPSLNSGDLFPDTGERKGDPYDIKQYDPSDGTSKILWKAFARSQELIVRREEKSITPEGNVSIFLIANKKEDLAASALESYLDELNKNNIEIFFSTDGENGEVIRNINKIMLSINQNVWSKNAGTGKDFKKFIYSLKTQNRKTRQIIIFSLETNSLWVKELNSISEKEDLKLLVPIVPEIPLEEKKKENLFISNLFSKKLKNKENNSLKLFSNTSNMEFTTIEFKLNR